MNKENKISVVINTWNAEQHLRKVLESVKDFDEVLVCDMESTDSTQAIAREYGCRVVIFPKEGHTIVEPAREFAIHEASHEWVLVIDADEVVTPQLKDYLYSQIAQPQCPTGIAIPRKNYFMGHFLHSDAKQKELALEHLANDSVSDILRKSNTYSDYELPRRRHKNYGLWALFSRPTFRFVKSYIIKKGFLDGKPGLIHALLDGYYQFIIVSKLMEERK